MEENLHIRFSESTHNVIDPKSSHDDGSKPTSDDEKKVNEDLKKDSKCKDQEKKDNVNNTNNVNTAVLSEIGPDLVKTVLGTMFLFGPGSMIGSLMYLRSSRPDIIFTVYAYARYQVNLKVSQLHSVKRIFMYLKGQPKLGLWYLKDSLFDLVACTDRDYTRASLDRKFTTRVTTAGVSVSTVEPIIEVVTTAEPSTHPPTTTTTVIEDEDLTISQTLMKIKSEKSKLQAELEEEERLAKQKEEDANIVEWDDVQAMIDADYVLATRLQAQ
nr:putative ribonuclease H-like domain-containing protein [Tanacetum cinerariifolium]